MLKCNVDNDVYILVALLGCNSRHTFVQWLLFVLFFVKHIMFLVLSFRNVLYYCLALVSELSLTFCDISVFEIINNVIRLIYTVDDW